jgi:hypothetical protein
LHVQEVLVAEPLASFPIYSLTQAIAAPLKFTVPAISKVQKLAPSETGEPA